MRNVFPRNIFFIYTVIIMLCISCMRKDDDTAAMVRLLNTSDTFYKEMPPRVKHLDTIYYQLFKEEERQIGLESIENGFDSLQLRIWYGGPVCGDRVIVLIHNNKKWSAKVIDINREIKGMGQRYPIEELITRTTCKGTVVNKKPRSGWRSLIRELFELKILSLPDIRNVKGLELEPVSDGSVVIVEVAAKNIYRAYTFPNPDIYSGKNDTAKKLVEIITLLEDELALEDLCDLRYKKNAAAQSEDKAAANNDSVVLKELTIDDRKPLPKRKK